MTINNESERNYRGKCLGWPVTSYGAVMAQNKTETHQLCLFDSQILFCKRAGSVGVNAVKHYLRRLWLVSITTILSKTFKIQFLFLSAIPHNWSFFNMFKQTFWSILGYHTTLIGPLNVMSKRKNKLD